MTDLQRELLAILRAALDPRGWVLAVLVLASPAHAAAPELDHYSEYGQFGITACALVGQAALDAKMTRRWYRAAAHMLRGCGRITTARIAESKARRARKGAFD